MYSERNRFRKNSQLVIFFSWEVQMHSLQMDLCDLSVVFQQISFPGVSLSELHARSFSQKYCKSMAPCSIYRK